MTYEEELKIALAVPSFRATPRQVQIVFEYCLQKALLKYELPITK